MSNQDNNQKFQADRNSQDRTQQGGKQNKDSDIRNKNQQQADKSRRLNQDEDEA